MRSRVFVYFIPRLKCGINARVWLIGLPPAATRLSGIGFDKNSLPARSSCLSRLSSISIINFKVERSSSQFVDPPLEPDLSPLEGGRIESTYVGTWPILSSWFFFFFFFSHRRQNDRAGIIIDDRFEKGVSVLSGLRRRFRVVEILYGTWETGRSRQNEQKPC